MSCALFLFNVTTFVVYKPLNLHIMLHKFENLTFNELPQAVEHLIIEVETLKALLESSIHNKVEQDHWFDVRELCQYVPDKPARQTVYGWIYRHNIPYHKKGKKLQFLKSEIDEWLKSDQRKTAAQLHAEAIEYVNRKARLNDRFNK